MNDKIRNFLADDTYMLYFLLVIGICGVIFYDNKICNWSIGIFLYSYSAFLLGTISRLNSDKKKINSVDSASPRQK